ncbi:SRPBCC family protein [Streptomyces sp. NPDC055056]
MAVRHRVIRKRPRDVWAVLADPRRYAEWVVGTAESFPARGRWPNVHAALEFSVEVGPFTLSNETVVRACVEGRELELEAKAGPLGTARIAIEVRPWGEYTLVIIDEHPLQGVGGFLHNVGVEALIQMRHRTMLARLAELCENTSAEPSRTSS